MCNANVLLFWKSHYIVQSIYLKIRFVNNLNYSILFIILNYSLIYQNFIHHLNLFHKFFIQLLFQIHFLFIYNQIYIQLTHQLRFLLSMLLIHHFHCFFLIHHQKYQNFKIFKVLLYLLMEFNDFISNCAKKYQSQIKILIVKAIIIIIIIYLFQFFILLIFILLIFILLIFILLIFILLIFIFIFFIIRIRLFIILIFIIFLIRYFS